MLDFLFFIVGACLGSFFNVCIYRIPRKKSIISPPSFCPQCEQPIKWYDNIPIISYCILRGRCRSCGGKIPIFYLSIELIAAGVFLFTYLKGEHSGSPLHETLIYLTFFSLLIIGAGVDAQREIIPDIITIPGIILGIAVSHFTIGIISSLLGAVIGTAVTTIFAILGKMLFKQEAMGGGDIKLLAMIGSFSGWPNALWVILFGSIIGLVFALLTKRRKIPFGPFLAIAAFITIIISFSTFYLTFLNLTI